MPASWDSADGRQCMNNKHPSEADRSVPAGRGCLSILLGVYLSGGDPAKGDRALVFEQEG